MTRTKPDLHLEALPVAKAEMLIRRPLVEVFEAFANPEITAHFWFTHGSDRLAPGKRVTWAWGMYNASAEVRVLEYDQDEFIAIEWPGEGGMTTVEWRFTPHGADKTFVSITNFGFHGNGDEVVRQIVDATEGFAIVLAGAKAYLEHGIELGLVGDRYPAPPEA